MEGAFNFVSLALARGANVEAGEGRLDDLLAPYGGLGAYDRTQQQSNAFIDAEITQLRSTALILPPVFFGISAFLVNMVIGRIIALERSEIGLLKALGYSDVEISVHYLLLAGSSRWPASSSAGRRKLAFARHGAALRGLLRLPLPRLLRLLVRLRDRGCARPRHRRARRRAVGDARGPPAPGRRHGAPRAAALPPHDLRPGDGRAPLSQPMMMILRSFVRWPVRSALSGLGLALAVAILVAASFFDDSLDMIIDTAFYQSNRQDVMLLFAEDVPETALEEIKALPGVLAAEGQQFHAAVLRHGRFEKRVPIEARRPGTDLSRIVTGDGRVVDAPPGGILLSETLADQLRAAPGDVVEVEFLSGRRETVASPSPAPCRSTSASAPTWTSRR
jgi:putative ABC transport system permease protein